MTKIRSVITLRAKRDRAAASVRLNDRQQKHARANPASVLAAPEYSRSAADKILGGALGTKLLSFLGKQELRGKPSRTASVRALLFGGC